MKNVLIFLMAIIFNMPISFAQTKNIAYKRLGGTALNDIEHNDISAIRESNLGVAPTRIVRNASLDSLIFINDTTTIMVTSNYCMNLENKETEFKLWHAGKDTIYNHGTFNGKLPIDTIKNILKKNYYFKNNIDSVKFINYYQENAVITNENMPKTDKASFFSTWVDYLIMIGVSMAIGLMVFIFSRKK